MTRKPGRRFPRSLAGGLIASALVVTVPSVARGQAAAPAAPKTLGTVERLDPRFDRLIPKDAALEVLADGYAWVEGPVWDRKEKRVLFSDIPNNRVIEWSESGGARPFLKPSGYTGAEPFTGREPGSNGLTFDKEGRLVLCQHGDRRIARREADGRFTSLVDRFEGKRFNSPNDLVFSSKGDLYFTDPPYGRPGTFDDPGRELAWQGVYRLSPDGKVSLLVKDLRAPNGIALSPDETTLYVTQSDMTRAVVMAYALTPEGTITGSRVFADLTAWKEKGPGAPDGMKVDKDGNVFTTGPGGLHVFTPKGEHLGSLLTGVPTANLAFGGDDGSVLYVTANTALCRIRTLTKGIGF